MVGHIGFHTAPGASYLKDWAPAEVEFGYTVSSAHRRRGYAREASLALMQWACQVHGVTEFLISVGRENSASRALAAALGFSKVGSHVDEVDGVEDVFTRSCAGWTASGLKRST
jgi:RimJ/RimL family protein N-acetyltransferase